MRTGPWVLGPDGTPCPGTLGVLADVVWGGAAVACAPAGLWGVSTEMTISYGVPLPADGSVLWGHGEVVYRDEHAALATGTVRTEDGRVVAAGTQRTRFAPAQPETRPLPAGLEERLATAGFGELIGLELGADGWVSLVATEAVSNPGGHVHGGIIFSIAELAASRAVAAVSSGLATSSVTTSYLRRAELGERIRCETEIAYRGRTAATAIVRCVRADGKACALSTANFGPVAASNG